jgi:hypothetical protein
LIIMVPPNKASGLYVPTVEIELRLQGIQEIMVRDGFDGVFLFQNMDLFYFSGTMQPGILFLQPREEPILFIRKNIDRAREESSLEKIVPLTSLRDLPATLMEMDIPLPQTLGLELDILPALTYLQIEKLFPQAGLLDFNIQLRRCRMIKSPWEIENLRQAAGMTAALVQAVPELLKPGLTELELAGRLDPSCATWDTRVSFGPGPSTRKSFTAISFPVRKGLGPPTSTPLPADWVPGRPSARGQVSKSSGPGNRSASTTAAAPTAISSIKPVCFPSEPRRRQSLTPTGP